MTPRWIGSHRQTNSVHLASSIDTTRYGQSKPYRSSPSNGTRIVMDHKVSLATFLQATSLAIVVWFIPL
ncbi:hypothetical protein G6F16_007643 [Rhizopus arrhizus]|nr:hypothetical protein G6F23_004778 [Rhizopus arrhizus]KAG0759710.1 hypothetical protein G6F24_008874 [Rhizopus arrhizus]KAG0786221.1 hypothetical protein G6F21_008743 [Rhizopus arrhizus]KAG0802330.1 hypothetical protein G6F22_000364 [Rhizopus arrhizus]KAG0808554.1 hypothetical protein G6F20_009484 [Rhizopus arrhizus]